jgi:hypothetical protein
MTLQNALDRLQTRPSIPLFVGEIWDAELDRALRETDPEALFAGRAVADARMAAGALAGLHLLNDNFETGHGICQAIMTDTGSYWHALCHRREGHLGSGVASNLSNARGWFRRAGDQPVYPAVRQAALSTLEEAGAGFRWATEAHGQMAADSQWDPGRMLDWFAQVDAGTLSPQTAGVLEAIQRQEIELALAWSIERALNG